MIPKISQRIHKHLAGFAAAGLVVAGLAAAGTAKADSPWLRRQVVVTFGAPVTVPHRVLPAGTYVFQLQLPKESQDIVGIYDASGKHLIENVLAIPGDRGRVSSNSVVTFAETASNTPPAVSEVFAAGHEYGYRFIYPNQ